MHAVVYRGKGEIGMEERPMPHIEEDTDAILRVTLTTICTSDLHIRNGAVPRAVPGIILGHEFVGIVEETGRRVKNVRPGQRVAVNVETFCGECFFCKRGFVNNCEDKNGGWALGCRIDCPPGTGRQRSGRSKRETQSLCWEQGRQACVL